MGIIRRPHQVDLTRERLNLRSVVTNLMGRLTWPSASLQARLWERLARWAECPCLRRMVDFVRAWLAFATNNTTYVCMHLRGSTLSYWIPAGTGMTPP